MRKISFKFLVFIVMLVFFLFEGTFINPVFSKTRRLSPFELSSKIPGMVIKDFREVPVMSLSYGSEKENMGYVPEILSGERHVSNAIQISSRARLLYTKNNEAYLFDWHNRNLKLIDLTSWKIKKVISIINFSRLSNLAKEERKAHLIDQIFQSNPLFGLDNKKIYILYRTRKSYVKTDIELYPVIKSYIELDPVKGKITGKEIEDFHVGTANIIIKEDPAYVPISRFIKDFREKHSDFLDFSFTSDKYGIITLSIITDKKLFLYRFKVDSSNEPFRFLKEFPYNSSYKDEERKVKIFGCENTFLVFINLGTRTVPANGGFRLELPGRMIVINKNDFNIIGNQKVDLLQWNFFTVFNNSIYTWDSRFTTKKFNIYRLEYTGDNPKLKEIFNKRENPGDDRDRSSFNINSGSEKSIYRTAIDIVKNKKLYSGRTIGEELDASFPTVNSKNRRWEASVSSDNDSTSVKYILSAGNLDSLAFEWEIPFNSRGEFDERTDFTESNRLALFIGHVNENYRREIILQKFSKREREIYLFLSQTIGNNDLIGSKAIEYEKRVYDYTSKKFGIIKQELKHIYDKIDKVMFGDPAERSK